MVRHPVSKVATSLFFAGLVMLAACGGSSDSDSRDRNATVGAGLACPKAGAVVSARGISYVCASIKAQGKTSKIWYGVAAKRNWKCAKLGTTRTQNGVFSVCAAGKSSKNRFWVLTLPLASAVTKQVTSDPAALEAVGITVPVVADPGIAAPALTEQEGPATTASAGANTTPATATTTPVVQSAVLQVASSRPVCGDWPGGEEVDKALDGDPSTKFVCYWSRQGLGGVEVDLASPGVLTGLNFTTGNDCPRRDPVRVRVSGRSGSAGSWVDLGAVTLSLPDDRNVQAGPFEVRNSVSYSSYRVLVETKKVNADCEHDDDVMQFADIEFLGAPVVQPVVLQVASSRPVCGDWPGGEEVDKALDGDPSTKFVCYWSRQGLGGVEVDLASPGVLTGLNFTTGNDCPRRDPVRVRVSGRSGSAGSWVDLGAVTLSLPDDRNVQAGPFEVRNSVSYSSYRVLVETKKVNADCEHDDDVMQFADIEFLGDN